MNIATAIEGVDGRARALSRVWAGKIAFGNAVTQHAQRVIPMQQDFKARQWQIPLQHERCIGAAKATGFAAGAGALKHQGHEPDSIRPTMIPTTKILAMRPSTSDEPI